MTTAPVLGWDIGGAHLKLAVLDGDGRLADVRIRPCAVWQGLDRLDGALDAILDGLDASGPSAVTMTAELADLWPDRETGVVEIAGCLARRLGRERLRFFTGQALEADPDGDQAWVRRKAASIASANWRATALYCASALPCGLLVDVGSTTTDLVPFAYGEVLARGVADRERLAAGELVYTGVVRTPVMALAERLPFRGAWIAPMAELFATAADVHRLTGDLPEGADLHPAADGRAKTPEASARRLLRMVGADLDGETGPAAAALAKFLSAEQLHRLCAAAARILSGVELGTEALLVGAGVGRFLAHRMAERIGLPYRGLGAVLTDDPGLQSAAADCAPAVAVARLGARA